MTRRLNEITWQDDELTRWIGEMRRGRDRMNLWRDEMKILSRIWRHIGWTALTSLEHCAEAPWWSAMFYLLSTSGPVGSGEGLPSPLHWESLDRLSTTIWMGWVRLIEPMISIGPWPAIRKVECQMRKLTRTMPKVRCRKPKLKGQVLNVGCEKMNVHSTELESRILKLHSCLWKVECRKRKLECCLNQSWMLKAKTLDREWKLKWQTQNVKEIVQSTM